MSRLVVLAINHILEHENWARTKLLPFAGQSAQIEVQALITSLGVTSEGLFEPASSVTHPPSVIIYLPDNSVAKIISGDFSAVFAAARISGSADFAEVLAFVFRNLKWDIEADLAGFIGDIAANRVVSSLNQIVNTQKMTAIRVANNFKEFVTEESRQVIPQREIEAFGQAVNTLRDNLERLEKRISRL